jgi:hypothetical protein
VDSLTSRDLRCGDFPISSGRQRRISGQKVRCFDRHPPVHSTVAFTLDIYSHVLPQVDAEAAEFIAVFGSRGI